MTDITLNIGSTPVTVPVKDFSFKWVEVFWQEAVSVTGKKRNNFRGYQVVLELNFEHQSELNAIAVQIANGISAGEVIQYVGEDGVIPVVPESFQSIDDYRSQIKVKPCTLVLEGDVQDSRYFVITGILCGATDVFCGAVNVRCG